MASQAQHMLEKLAHLSPDRLIEVEDFIDFLQQRDQDKRVRHDFSHATEASFSKVWDNSDDALYDRL
jgi:uncharacterized membrane protein